MAPEYGHEKAFRANQIIQPVSSKSKIESRDQLDDTSSSTPTSSALVEPNLIGVEKHVAVMDASILEDKSADASDATDIEKDATVVIGGELSESQQTLLQICFILLAVWVGVLLSVVDETMTATLLTPISTSFNSFENLSWIATTYLLGMSVTQPVMGHLADLFGRRDCLLIGNLIFMAGSLICGLSKNLPTLLVGRSIEGLGGGVIVVICAIVETDLVSTRNRAFTEGIGGILYGLALSAGGLYGGGLNDAIGWRWAFLIQVPLMLGPTLAIWKLVRIPKATKTTGVSSIKRLDYIGLSNLVLSVILVQIGLDCGGNTLPWTHPLVLISLPLALITFLIFVIWDLWYAKEPAIPIRLLGEWKVASNSIVYFFSFAGFYSCTYFMPIYLQAIGLSTTQTGLRFTTQAIGAAASILGAGLLIKISGKYYYLNFAGQVCHVVGSGLMIMLDVHTKAWAPYVFMGLLGVGFGTTWVTSMMAMLSSIPSDKQAVMQSAGTVIRYLGMVIGFSITSGVFQKILKSNLEDALAGQAATATLIDQVRTNFDSWQVLSPVAKYAVQEAYVKSLHVVFYITTTANALAFLVSVFQPENSLDDLN